MESIRHSARNSTSQNDLSYVTNSTTIAESQSPYGRHPTMPGLSLPIASHLPSPGLQEESRRSSRASGMRGGMSQFRAQPIHSKQQLRVKQYDPTRKNYVIPKDNEVENQDRSVSRDTNGYYDGTEALDERMPTHQRASSSDEMNDVVNHLGGILSPAGSELSSGFHGSNDFTPQRLAGIVSYSIYKCRETRMITLGLAIKRLWEDSHSDPRLAHVLGAVLSKTASEQEKTELQELITMNREKAKIEIAEHKAKQSAAASISVPVFEDSKSPSQAESLLEEEATPSAKSPTRPTRSSARKSSAKSRDVDDRPSSRTPSVNGKRPKSSTNLKLDDIPMSRTPSANGKRARPSAPLIEEIQENPQPKKLKRTASDSSGSSLSSVPSDVEQELDQDVDMSDEQKATRSSKKLLVALPKQDPKNKGPPKKVLGNFDAPKINGKTMNTADEPATKAREQKKQDLMRNFIRIKVNPSNIRSSVEPLSTRSFGSSDLFPNLNSASRKRQDTDDLESIASSANDDLLVPPPPEARRSSRSRQATPNAQPSRAISARTSARIKISPHKKGSDAARMHELDPDFSDSDDPERDNNDFCSTCGASGRLLCCDGCIRAFHFNCLDPRIDENNPPEGSWFCTVCEAKRHDPLHRARRGLFSFLRAKLRKSNPSVYSIPKHIREYYEGVSTGDNGEYVEVSADGKINKIRLTGLEDEKKLDNTKLIDKKGLPILCFACGGSSLAGGDAKREIIACDHCALNWHLDCLSPPLANPPFKDPQNRAKYRWRCPAHADSVINAVGVAGRPYKLRRPKNARVVDTQLRRGFKSRGAIIDIELEESSEESDVDDEPPIYRVTEKSVLLDFEARLRRERDEQSRRQAVVDRLRARDSAQQLTAMQAYRARSSIEKQALAGLATMANATESQALSSDQVKEVVDALLTEAPDNVLALLDQETAAGGTTDISGNSSAHVPKQLEVQQLILLRELIGERLLTLGHVS